MSEDIVKQRGTQGAYQDDRGGASLYSNPILGIVKNNIDPLRAGRIQVYLNRLNSSNQDDPANWTTVSYMSPFFGYTPNTGSPDSNGEFVGNPNSYGFWATPPDVGTQVVCIFINGDPNFGYYIGGVPKEGLTHMVPGVGASNNIIPNEGEANSYGGATRLPVSEYNNANDKQDRSPSVATQPRPIHSYQAAILNKQGLIRDPNRGTIGSSSMRESPSRVFGMSTPGRPIYEGGYNDTTIAQAIAAGTTPAENYQVIGRTGGHSIVMDDGDVQGRDQLVRIRTAQGHMILMNDYAETLFIIHANGQSYIELGKEGTIDMYSTNSVNVRTQGDLNLHADSNININATKDLNISAKNIKLESIESTTQFTGTGFKQYTKGDHTVKVDSKMTLESTGDSMIRSGATNYINGGPNVMLNSGSSSLSAQKVEQIPIVAHTDTLQDPEKGYAPAPGKLPSIVSRAPAHTPWANANQGVNVKTTLDASKNLPANPSPAVTQTNEAAAGSQIKPTKPSVVSTVPPVSTPVSNNATPATTPALVSQMAVNAASGPAASAIAQAAGVVETNGSKVAAVGPLALTPAQLAEAGYIKPGAEKAINAAIERGIPIQKAIPKNVLTGKDGVTSLSTLATDTTAQTKIATTLMENSFSQLKKSGIISGLESITQVGGLVLSAATAGIAKTVDFVKNAATQIANGLGIKTPTLPNAGSPIAGDVGSLISSGKFAANLADKNMGTLGGVNVGENLKGLAAGAFNAITSGCKKLKAGVPQTLFASATTQPAEQASANQNSPEGQNTSVPTASVKDTLKNVFEKVSSAAKMGAENITASLKTAEKAFNDIGVPGIKDIPGGTAAVTNIVDAKNSAMNQLPGLGNIKQAVNNVVSNVSAGVKAGPDKLINDAKSAGLSALSTSGLNPEAAAQLQGAISSMGAGGPVKVKAPTVAVDSFDFSKMQEQAKVLLGNPKIPPLNFGSLKIPSQPLTESQIKEFDRLKELIDKEEDNMFSLRKQYLDDLEKYGKNSQITKQAELAYKESLIRLENYRNQQGQAVSAGPTA